MIRHPAVPPAVAWAASLLVLGSIGRCSAAELPTDLDLVPRDAAMFFHFRAADIYKTDWMADFRYLAGKAGPAALKTFQQKFVPDPATIDRVTLVMVTPKSIDRAFPNGNPEGLSALVIVRTSKPYDRLRLMESLGLREKLYRRHLYYFNEDLWSGLVLIDSQTFLLASEDALIQFFDLPADARKDGPLQPALLTAADKHQLTIGLNAPALGKELGGGPPALAKMFESRCITMSFDLDKDLHYVTRFEYAKDAEAEAGAKTLRELLDFFRDELKNTIADGEKRLKRKDENRNLPDSLTDSFGYLFGLGILREVDRVLKEAPIQAQGPTVTLDITYKGLPSMNTAVLGLMGVSLFEGRASRSFDKQFSGAFGGPDPHESHLKTIAEALDKYHDDKGTYPPAAILDKDGRPLLSWRVALLPYLGEEGKALYDEFNKSEPWDSLHNKKLLLKMPQAYHSPSSYQQFKTATLLYSAGSLFGTKGVKKTDLKAGAALLAEGSSANAVYWSKPADFNVVEGKPLPNFWGSEGNRPLHVLFADGSVRKFTKDKADDKLLREMAKPSGAKLPPLDKIEKPRDEKKDDGSR